MPRGYLVLIGLVALALVVPLFVGGEPDAPEATAVVATSVTPAAAPAAAGRADPVLSRARAALHAGRLEAPEGRNALDLFQAVLLAQPEQREAQASLARTVDLLLQRAQQEFDAGNKPEAERLLQRVLAVVPDAEQARTLAHRISPPDTPSRQLSREQRAEVEARLTGNTSDSPAAPTHARTLEEIQTELAALPGPVTKLSGTSAASSAAAPKIPAPVVRPDPLAPRFVNPMPALAPAARSYAREPVNAPPTAGVTGPTARYEPAEPAFESASLSAR